MDISEHLASNLILPTFIFFMDTNIKNKSKGFSFSIHWTAISGKHMQHVKILTLNGKRLLKSLIISTLKLEISL